MQNYTRIKHEGHEKKRKLLPNEEVLDCWTNSPCQRLWKCIENSMENMHTDVPPDWVPFRHK